LAVRGGGGGEVGATVAAGAVVAAGAAGAVVGAGAAVFVGAGAGGFVGVGCGAAGTAVGATVGVADAPQAAKTIAKVLDPATFSHSRRDSFNFFSSIV